MNLVRATLAAVAAVITLLPAAAQDTAVQGEPLQLKSRFIDVHIDENLALITYVFNVYNPNRQVAEGQFSFDVPKGATGIELTLLRNIASSERAAKVLEPAEALAVYEAVKSKDLKLDNVQSLDLIQFSTGLRPFIAVRNASGVANTTMTVPTGNGTTIPGPGTRISPPPSPFTSSSPPPSPFSGGSPVPNSGGTPTSGIIRTHDPAILECVSPTSYRVRCFPILPERDETVTVVFAMEVSESGGARTLSLPTTLRSNAKAVAKAPEMLSLTMISAGGYTELSGSHDLAPAVRYCRGYESQRSLVGRPDVFTLKYANSRSAKPYDFTKTVGVDEIVVPEAQAATISTERSVQAVRVRRLIEALVSDGTDGNREKAKVLAGRAKVACALATLIVIEKHELTQALKGLRTQ